jgi:hypothetical protein
MLMQENDSAGETAPEPAVRSAPPSPGELLIDSQRIVGREDENSASGRYALK